MIQSCSIWVLGFGEGGRIGMEFEILWNHPNDVIGCCSSTRKSFQEGAALERCTEL